MIGLDYIMAGYIHLAAGEIKCEVKKSPEISVSASDTALKIDHSKTQAELDRFQIDTVSPYSASMQAHVGGLMSGEVKTSSNMRIMSETYPALNAACLLVDKITVKIQINPTIYVAKHYKKDSCMYRAIMVHEQKHVKTDRLLVNKYTSLIIKALDTHYKKAGYAYGPVQGQELPALQNKISETTNKIVRDYSEKMNAERRVLQQKIDSLEEYNHVSNSCRGRK